MGYFASTTTAQRQADWEELKAYNEYGPLVISLENVQYHFVLSLQKEVAQVTAEDETMSCNEDCSLAA